MADLLKFEYLMISVQDGQPFFGGELLMRCEKNTRNKIKIKVLRIPSLKQTLSALHDYRLESHVFSFFSVHRISNAISSQRELE